MPAKDLTQLIKHREGFVLSEGTLQPLHLLCEAHDIMNKFGANITLRNKIKKAVGLGADLSATVSCYYGRLRPTVTAEELSELFNDDIFTYFNSIAPSGYYFGSSEGDGACIGWFKDI